MTLDVAHCTTCQQGIPSPYAACPWCGTLNPHHIIPNGLPAWFQQPHIPICTVRQSQIPTRESHYLTLGGGMGSFAWVDYLRVHGVPADHITIIGHDPIPYGRFRQLCRSSQIHDQDRIRSDSGSRPDNVWGWPGYGLEEMVAEARQGHWRKAVGLGWQLLTEPLGADTYAPRATAVYRSLQREMRRIGWARMMRPGEICAVRQTDNGRYLIAYLPKGNPTPHFHLTTYLHLALGYSHLNLTPESTTFRHQFGNLQPVVQAYEPHEHVYRQLAQRGGILLLRGRGIVAARILQRLDDIRRTSQQDIRVIHVLRRPLTEDTYYGLARRKTRHHWQWQPFNWPKAAFGGDLRQRLAQASPPEREALLSIWGGTTAGDRQAWHKLLEQGLAEGWYQLYFGEMESVRENGRFRLITTLRDYDPPHTQRHFVADFVLDCTGLSARLADHPILAEMQQMYYLPQNPAGKLLTTDQFELKGMRNGEAHAFLVGINAYGNAFAPVDSFLGLQYAAQRTLDRLLAEGAPGLRPRAGLDSLRQWWRWWRQEEP